MSSSVGLERRLDKAEVVRSIRTLPTNSQPSWWKGQTHRTKTLAPQGVSVRRREKAPDMRR